ncbi:MAG: Crp/Fnr family transcriptional regulator [Bellilinea sp.]
MMMPLTLLIDTLKSIPWFLDFNSKQLERLASISTIMEVSAGEVIFCEGDRADNMYIILDGQIAVDSAVPGHDPVRIYQAEALDIIGWSKMVPVIRQRVATTTALKDSRLLVINGDDLAGLCEEDNHVGFVIMRRLANVVATNMLTTKLQLLDLILQLSGEHSGNPAL